MDYRSHLESDTFVCMEWDTADISDDNEFLMKLQGYSVDFVVALHAYKAGRYLSEKGQIYFALAVCES